MRPRGPDLICVPSSSSSSWRCERRSAILPSCDAPFSSSGGIERCNTEIETLQCPFIGEHINFGCSSQPRIPSQKRTVMLLPTAAVNSTGDLFVRRHGCKVTIRQMKKSFNFQLDNKSGHRTIPAAPITDRLRYLAQKRTDLANSLVHSSRWGREIAMPCLEPRKNKRTIKATHETHKELTDV